MIKTLTRHLKPQIPVFLAHARSLVASVPGVVLSSASRRREHTSRFMSSRFICTTMGALQRGAAWWLYLAPPSPPPRLLAQRLEDVRDGGGRGGPDVAKFRVARHLLQVHEHLPVALDTDALRLVGHVEPHLHAHLGGEEGVDEGRNARRVTVPIASVHVCAGAWRRGGSADSKDEFVIISSQRGMKYEATIEKQRPLATKRDALIDCGQRARWRPLGERARKNFVATHRGQNGGQPSRRRHRQPAKH